MDGRTTAERLAEVWEQVVAADEHITVAEFARRAHISRDTLNHRYPEWAAKCRERRDAGRTRGYSNIVGKRLTPGSWDEAIAEVADLRRRYRQLEERCKSLERERDRLGRRASLVEQRTAENERLRGVIVAYQQLIYRRLDPDDGDRALRIVEEWAPSTTQDDAAQSEG